MNNYSFAAFRQAVDTNRYRDDALLQRLLAKYAPGAADDAIDEFGALCSGKLRELADSSALIENRPYLRHYDAFNNRVDDVVLPASTERAYRIVEGRNRLHVPHGNTFVHYAKGYLFQQSGEAGVGCSIACTDGAVRVLDKLGDHEMHRKATADIRASTFERYHHAAQFVTEIQGGSDAGENVVVAREAAGSWTLHGQKWFCSNVNADYFIMTARPERSAPGGRGVALFLVPAFLDDDKRVRNGYTIDRLKDKLGTRELATAECTFDGAEAYPLGPLDRGLANVVSNVLVTSRFACSSVAASFLRGAERYAEAYAEFRTAFGQKLQEFPLVRESLAEIRNARERSLAILFELTRMWPVADAADATSNESLDFRYLMSMVKPVLTRRATQVIHEAIMIHGAQGIEEQFSPLPRLWRDAIIMETWEGPHNVLFSQALRDMARFEVDPSAFVARVTGGNSALAAELGEILSGARSLEATVPFAAWAERLVDAWGERLVADV